MKEKMIVGLAWVLSIISSLALGVIMFLGRDSVMTIGMLLFRNAYLPRFLDKAYLYVFGIIWLLSWIGFDGYYSGGVKRGTLAPRFWLVTGIELILLFLARIWSTIYQQAGTNWTVVALLVLVLVVGAALVIFSRKQLLKLEPKKIPYRPESRP